MKAKLQFYFLLIFAMSSFIVSCSSDDDQPEVTEAEKAAFIKAISGYWELEDGEEYSSIEFLSNGGYTLQSKTENVAKIGQYTVNYNPRRIVLSNIGEMSGITVTEKELKFSLNYYNYKGKRKSANPAL